MNRRISHKYPSLRMKEQMEASGCQWMPKDKRDNKSPNYECRDIVEEAYQMKIKEYERTMKWFESLYEPGEEVDAEEYLWLKLPINEKLKAPDSDFIYDGLHKSMMPTICCSGREAFRRVFKDAHKGNWIYWRVRVPSLKRGKSTWQKFYNEFPTIAAEVKLGNRRFVNGAKLKYIW